ncbi:hypothetical protein Q0O53_13745, partial [Staphylococcus aureus]|nr:hypothetical protein [Staphylococcus aureus]
MSEIGKALGWTGSGNADAQAKHCYCRLIKGERLAPGGGADALPDNVRLIEVAAGQEDHELVAAKASD